MRYYQMILKALGKTLDSTFTEEEKIVSLQGIEKLKNLTSLSLRNSSGITSIERLRNLTQMRNLELPDTVTDLSPVEGMTELSYLFVMDANISTLPDLTKYTELIGHYTYLQGNNLTEAELTSKLPKQLVKDKKWLKQTIDLQKYNVKKKLKVTSPNKVTRITSRTKKIVGKADKSGTFKMKNLNLKKYKKKKLILKSYYKNNYYWEEWEMKTFNFKLKK